MGFSGKLQFSPSEFIGNSALLINKPRFLGGAYLLTTHKTIIQNQKQVPLLNWPKLTVILILARLSGVVVLLLYHQSLSSLYHQYTRLQQYAPHEQV